MNTSSPFFRFIVGLDQALNPIVYGGSEDVTISAQTAYCELVLGKKKRIRKIIDWVFKKFGEDKHCYWSLYVEIDEFPKDIQLSILRILETHGVGEGF